MYNLLEEITLAKKEIIEKKNESKNPILPILISFQLITLWERADSGFIESKAKIQLVDPGEKILAESEYNFKIEPYQERARYIANFNGLPFTESGIYSFRILREEGDGFVQVGEAKLRLKIGG